MAGWDRDSPTTDAEASFAGLPSFIGFVDFCFAHLYNYYTPCSRIREDSLVECFSLLLVFLFPSANGMQLYDSV